MVKHILPNILTPILVVATLELGVVIVTEASLSFPGLGVDASQASWGGRLADGQAYITHAWWLATLPGLAIFVVVLAVNILGDGVRDALDPRMHSRRQTEELLRAGKSHWHSASSTALTLCRRSSSPWRGSWPATPPRWRCRR